MTRAPIILEGVRAWSRQSFGAPRRGQVVFQKLIFELEAIQFGAELAALFARVPQFEVVGKEAGGSVADARSRWPRASRL